MENNYRDGPMGHKKNSVLTYFFDHTHYIQWYPEITLHCPNTPIILVGTKKDLRDDKETVEDKGYQSISTADGVKLQSENVNVVKYMECSALTQFGVKDVINEAVKVALAHKTSQRTNTTCVLS